jgi:hypothetical protein
MPNNPEKVTRHRLLRKGTEPTTRLFFYEKSQAVPGW